MTYGRFLAVLLCGALFLSTTACDDPSTVGVGVGPDSLEGGTPKTIDVGPASPRIASDPSVTGNDNPGGQWRTLVGAVNDPLSGPLQADSYFDLRSPVAIPDTVLNASAADLTAELTLAPSYFHGDTTSTIRVAMYDVTEEMDVAGATSDQTFPSEPTPIQTITVSADNDSLVTVEMPTEWVEEHLDVLQDTSDAGGAFADAFHGLRLEGRSGNAILGFNRSGITLELQRTDTDISSQYPAVKLFSHIERTGEKPDFGGRFVAIDGLGEDYHFAFDFSAPPLDTLSGAFVNRASILAPVDTSAWNQMRPEHFVRPRRQLEYRTVATLSETTDFVCATVGTVAISDTSSTCAIPMETRAAPGAALTNLTVSLEIFRRSLLSGSIFSQYRIEIAEGRPSQNALGIGLPSTLPVAFYGSGAASSDSTRATLTVTLQ